MAVILLLLLACSTVAAAAAGRVTHDAAHAMQPSDADDAVRQLLSVALAQEVLAATFFRMAATGEALPPDVGAPAPVGGRKAQLSAAVRVGSWE